MELPSTLKVGWWCPERAMAQSQRSKWNYLLIAVFVLFVVALGWQIITGSGLLPGDTGTEPVAGTDETTSGSGHMDLAAWPWTLFLLAGTIVLGAAIGWGEFQSRRGSRRDWQAGEAKTREIYKQDR
jgi:hypothetical protein